jgi:hypothetical protein
MCAGKARSGSISVLRPLRLSASRRCCWSISPHRSTALGRDAPPAARAGSLSPSDEPREFRCPGPGIRPGPKTWRASTRYKRRAVALADTHRRLQAARKRDHGELANHLLAQGTTIQTEKLSYRAFRRRFGRSVQVRAPSAFITQLTRKAESAGGGVVLLDTRSLRMSQYDHVTGLCTEKNRCPSAGTPSVVGLCWCSAMPTALFSPVRSRTARTIHPGEQGHGRLRRSCCDARDCARPNRRAGWHRLAPRHPCR